MNVKCTWQWHTQASYQVGHETWKNQHDLKSDVSIWISMTLKRELISHNSVSERDFLFPHSKEII